MTAKSKLRIVWYALAAAGCMSAVVSPTTLYYIFFGFVGLVAVFLLIYTDELR